MTAATARRAGLVVMAYGTPRSPDEVEAYYTHIRRGRPPSPEELADLQQRYEAIGGVSPLATLTARQADAIGAALAGAEPGVWRVGLGNKHVAPFLEDAVAEMAADRPDVVVGLVMAPHWSRASVGQYHERAGQTAADRGVPYVGVDHWHDVDAWLDAQAVRVRAALAGLPPATRVLFSAHSLPERALVDDHYADQLATSAGAIAARVGLADPPGWSLAWQSAGRTPEPWRGPDVTEVLRQLGKDKDEHLDGVLVCPQGFVTDHLEVLYDLDVQAAEVAADAGLAFARTASIDDDPAVMRALADLVRSAAGSA
jgi:protoporphyrin/coproporphyrin ferrochelatase